MSDDHINMEDLTCLFEFPNERNSISVGYAAWIVCTEEKITEEWLSDIIENNSQVEVRWPDVEVLPPKAMSRLLTSKKEISWENCVAVIHAYGCKYSFLNGICLELHL